MITNNAIAGTIPYLESRAASKSYADIHAIHREMVESMKTKEEAILRAIFSDALGREFTDADAGRFRIVSQIGMNDYHITLDGIQICKVKTKMDDVSSTGEVKITTYYEKAN